MHINKRTRYETGLCPQVEWISIAIMFVAFTLFATIAGAGLFGFVVGPLVMLFSGSTDGVSLGMHIVGLVVCIASTVLPTWHWGLDRNRLWTGVEIDSDGVIFIASVFSSRAKHKNITLCEFAYAQLSQDGPKSAASGKVAENFLVRCRIFATRRSRPFAIFLRHTDAEAVRSILEERCAHATFRTQTLPSWLEEKSPEAKSLENHVAETPTIDSSQPKALQESFRTSALSDEESAKASAPVIAVQPSASPALSTAQAEPPRRRKIAFIMTCLSLSGVGVYALFVSLRPYSLVGIKDKVRPMFDTIPPFGLWPIAAVLIGSFAAGVACVALRRRVRIIVMIGCLAFSALSIYAHFLWYRPYSLEVRLGTFSTILSDTPGRAVIITNNDARAAIIKAVVVNDEFSVTQSLDSIPRGKVVDYPVTVLPGDTLKLMISESRVNSRLLPPTFKSLFPNEARMLDKHKKPTKPKQDSPKPASTEYDKDIMTINVDTDLGSKRFQP